MRKDHNKHPGLSENLPLLGTEQLEDMLRMDCNSHAPLDIDTIAEISSILAERYQQLGLLKPSDEAFASFKKHYWPMVENNIQESAVAPSPTASVSKAVTNTQKKSPVPLRFTSNCVAAIILLLSLTLVIPTAFGADNVFTVIGEWSDNVFTFIKGGFISTETQNDLNRLSCLVEAVCGTAEVVPKWLPNGYTLSTLESFGDAECSSVFATFNIGDRSISFQYASIYDGASVNYEKDNTDVVVYYSHGQDYYIMKNNGFIFCAWASGIMECHIFGDMSLEEIYKIIDSI